MGNFNLQDKNRIKAVAGVEFPAQSKALPIPSGVAGLYSNGTRLYAQDPSGANDPVTLNRGTIPASRLAFSANPANADTIAIGTITFTFLSTLIAATAQVQVKRGANAAATLVNLIAAINGDTTNANWVEATTAFAATVVADAVTATSLRIRKADARGGTVTSGTIGSTLLTASITAGASAWSIANLNATGKSKEDVYQAVGKITITAAMITAGAIHIELPFSPTVLFYQAQSSAGVLRNPSDVVAVSTGTITITLGGGASPNLQANDVFSYDAQL